MTNRMKTGIIISLMCFVLLAAAGIITTVYYVQRTLENVNAVKITNGTSPANVVNVSADTGEKLTVAEIAKKAGPAIVSIDVESTGMDFFGRAVSSTGSGSGIIFSEDGYIITNNHVIEGADKVSVKLADGTEYAATLIGRSADKDLAVLKVDAKGLPFAVLGDSDKLNVGDPAVALGDPLGKLSGTVTTGIISATNRELSVGTTTMNLLQTDATVNPGNSGGALCNEYGEVIGVVNSKVSATGVEGLGFAIPINDVKPVITQLIEKGSAAANPESGAGSATRDEYRKAA